MQLHPKQARLNSGMVWGEFAQNVKTFLAKIDYGAYQATLESQSLPFEKQIVASWITKINQLFRKG